jgi:membrane-bound serine protease (ClpP class)
VNSIQPTVGDFIVALDGQTVKVAGKPVKLDTADVVGEGKDRRRQPNQEVRFHKLDLGQQLAHTLVTPWVAYFFFVAGFALIVFEFFTAGVGIAGFVGAVAVIGACFGFSHLPVQWWAIALLLLGLLGLSIDLQAGGLGAWTFIGAASLVAGSVTLYGGSSRLDPSWWVIALVCGGTVLFMLSGMTAMIRSRFSTPTIGREELIGEMGVAEVDVAPDGVVRIHDALWRARTNRATPITAGAEIRVVAVEGIVLEVEPPEGGARDHRERARRPK